MTARDDVLGDAVCVVSYDSSLGRWTSATYAPPASSPLHGAVTKIWYFDGVMSQPRERVFPDGTAELIVMLDEPHRDGDFIDLPRFPPVCINGIRTRPSVVVAPPGRCRVLGVRFLPAAAVSIVRSAMTALVDVTIDLSDAVGTTASELAERCADARTPVDIVNAAALWVLHRLRLHGGDRCVDFVAGAIQRARGDVSVEELLATVNIGEQRFVRSFRERVGVTPKRFARIVRFHHALEFLRTSSNIAVSALELGYYDQSHLYRDFGEFARMTPKAYLSSVRYPNGSNLAES